MGSLAVFLRKYIGWDSFGALNLGDQSIDRPPLSVELGCGKGSRVSTKDVRKYIGWDSFGALNLGDQSIDRPPQSATLY